MKCHLSVLPLIKLFNGVVSCILASVRWLMQDVLDVDVRTCLEVTSSQLGLVSIYSWFCFSSQVPNDDSDVQAKLNHQWQIYE